MSYGWLTESALLPTRAVPIRGVSDSSLFSLSNHIFTLQQENQEQQQQQSLSPPTARAGASFFVAGGRAAGERRISQRGLRRSSNGSVSEEGTESNEEEYEAGEREIVRAGEASKRLPKKRCRKLDAAAAERRKKRRKGQSEEDEEEKEEGEDGKEKTDFHRLRVAARTVWKRPSRKPRTREEMLLQGKNARVEERAAKDEKDFHARQKTFATSRKRLEEKAKLYDALVSGHLHGSDAPPGACLVVNFEEKTWQRSSGSAPSIFQPILSATDTEEEQKANVRSTKEPKDVDLLCRYHNAEEQEKRQEEHQKARQKRLEYLRLRLISLREAAMVASLRGAIATGGLEQALPKVRDNAGTTVLP